MRRSDWVIDGYTHGRVADRADCRRVLMAIFLQGMTGARGIDSLDRRPCVHLR